jgi:hypothetical protein
MDFRESDEQKALRSAVGNLAGKFGRDYIEPLARSREFPREPDAGSNSHKIVTTARKDGTDWLLSGRKVY